MNWAAYSLSAADAHTDVQKASLLGHYSDTVSCQVMLYLIRLNLAIAWFKLLRISSRVFGNDADAVLHISSASVHFGLGVQ